MDRLAQHVVDAGREHAERLLERGTLLERQHRGLRAFADHARNAFAALAIADQKSFDRRDVVFARLGNPLLEFAGLDTCV